MVAVDGDVDVDLVGVVALRADGVGAQHRADGRVHGAPVLVPGEVVLALRHQGFALSGEREQELHALVEPAVDEPGETGAAQGDAGHVPGDPGGPDHLEREEQEPRGGGGAGQGRLLSPEFR